MTRRNTGGVQQRGDSYRISYYADGRRQFETFADRETAERELARRIADKAAGIPVSSRPNTVLFGELAVDVLNDYRVNKRKSIDDIDDRFRLHIIPIFGNRKAAAITTAQLNAYIVRRQSEVSRGKVPATGTINRELEAIRHTFKLAMQHGKLMHMPHVPHLRESNTRTGFFTEEEVLRLCSHLKPMLAAFVRFAFLTGWRKSEISNLRWSNVDFAAGEIRLDPGSTKNGEGRVFPMSADLRNLLTAASGAFTAPENSGYRGSRVMRRTVAALTPYVFAINGRPILEFRKSWLTACHKAKLPCVLNIDGKPIKAIRIFHDLRRSAIRNFIKAGMSEAAAMRLSGHKTRSVFDRYNVVSEADLREAVRKMDGAKNGAIQSLDTALDQ